MIQSITVLFITNNYTNCIIHSIFLTGYGPGATFFQILFVSVKVRLPSLRGNFYLYHITMSDETHSTTVTYIVYYPVIEKLDGIKNYESWKFRMKMVSIDYGLWNCVTRSDTNADRDLDALAKISLFVKPLCSVHLRSANTSKQGWGNLPKG